MRKKNYKGRCQKRTLSKSKEVCRFYDAIQSKYADILQKDKDIEEYVAMFRLKVCQRESLHQIFCV